MGCGCGGKGGAAANIQYEVKIGPRGAPPVKVLYVDTKQAARIEIQANGQGGTYKAVPKK